jgi:hypothetical protein
MLCETIFQAFLHVFFIFLPSSLLANSQQPYFEISDDHPPNTEPRTVTHARDHWWTFDFANAFVSPGVNSRAELVPSPRAYAWNGASRRRLGDTVSHIYSDPHLDKCSKILRIFCGSRDRKICFRPVISSRSCGMAIFIRYEIPSNDLGNIYSSVSNSWNWQNKESKI